jgi:hypothetical protein
LLVLSPVASASAGADLDVGGSARGGAEPSTLEVLVALTNRGDRPATSLVVTGELLGAEDQAGLERPLGAGETGEAALRFPLQPPRPGTYPVVLLLGYEDPPGRRLWQCAFLLVSLGQSPEPALGVDVPPLDLSVQATLGVALRSADGRPHRARLRVHVPPPLRVLDSPEEVQVPGSGAVEARVRLMRATGVDDTDVGIVVLASANEGDVESTVATTGMVHVHPARGWLPRLRPALLVASCLLLLLSLAGEVWNRRRSGSA